MLDPTVAAQAGASGWSQLHQILDHGEPIAFELIGANVGYFRPWDGSTAHRQANLVYQLQFPKAWVVVTLVVTSNANGRHISSANFQPASDSLQILNRFTLSKKSVVHYLFLSVCILIPLFIITTIVLCVRSRVRRRWLWIVFILIGFVQFRFELDHWRVGCCAAFFQFTRCGQLSSELLRSRDP